MARKIKARHNTHRSVVLEHAADTAKSIAEAIVMVAFLLAVAAMAIHYG